MFQFRLTGQVEEMAAEGQLSWIVALLPTLSAWIVIGDVLLLFWKSEEGLHFYLEWIETASPIMKITSRKWACHSGTFPRATSAGM